MSDYESEDDTHSDEIPPMTVEEAEALSLVPTAHLIEALQRRHRASLVVLNKSLNDDEETTNVWWSGGFVAALGMMEYAKLQASLSKSKRPARPEDDI